MTGRIILASDAHGHVGHPVAGDVNHRAPPPVDAPCAQRYAARPDESITCTMFPLHIHMPGREASASALRTTLSDALERLYARDTALPAHRLASLLVTDETATEGEAAGRSPLQRTDTADGYRLTLSARFAEQALAGDPEQVLELVHLLHRELWRGELAQEHAPKRADEDALMAQFSPIVDLMFDEYRANRASAWSLPGRSDLLLPHLMGLLQELPAACDRARADYQLDGDLDALTGLSMARLALLMQSVAFSLGYLAGLGRTVADIAPELKDALDNAFIAREWPRISALLAGAANSRNEDRAVQLDLLRIRVMAIFEGMGLRMRVDGSGLRVDVSAASTGALEAAAARLTAGEGQA